MKPISFSNKFLLTAILFAFSFLSCIKKNSSGSDSGTYLEQYFESSVLNKNFIINLATNNGADITSNYSGYTFTLLKTDFYHGPLQVSKGSSIYTGTWASNADYSKLTITLPSQPSEFNFIARDWRFTKKELPQLELAPWGSTDPAVLHMLQQ